MGDCYLIALSSKKNNYREFHRQTGHIPGPANISEPGYKKTRSVLFQDRSLVRFYAPQLAQHTDALALAIDEFIDVVEHRLPPREFVQKGKLVGSAPI